MLKLENDILRLIARGSPLGETMTELCRRVETALPGIVCTVMTVDPAGLLRPLAAPSLPQSFSAAIDGVMIGPNVGSCGTAAYLRAPVAVADIANDPKWSKYRDLTLAIGLKACLSAPVIREDGVPIAVIAFYFRKSGVRGRKVMSTCVELCGLALRRQERVADRERRVNVDALTGLPNRAAFNAAIASLPCDQPGGWSLLVVDLDNLKVVNDTFGHQAGDALIRAAGERIARVMAPDATFRLGGDEFAVIVQNSEFLSDLDGTSMRIFAELERPADLAGHSVIPGATIGGAVFGADDADAESVYQNADFALYHAKETGRGGFVRYWLGIGTRITHRRDAIRDVDAALTENRIDAFYQPVVRLDTREIVGVEALCRLKTPGGQIIAAESFHEATTDARIAAQLTERMLAIVANDVRTWIDQGIPFQHVGVNVSSADFYKGDLRRKLEQSFGRAGVSLDHLILEVNEDVYMGQRDKVVAREIVRLRESGLRVALDDFGTGYASLTHLMNVPVDAIKIDRSFIARLWPDDPSMAIVQGLIDIARKLDIRIIAEGIETDVQASQLWTMGCKLGQGFVYSRAVDRVGMTTLLRRHAQGLEGVIPLYPREMVLEVESAADDCVLARTGTR